MEVVSYETCPLRPELSIGGWSYLRSICRGSVPVESFGHGGSTVAMTNKSKPSTVLGGARKDSATVLSFLFHFGLAPSIFRSFERRRGNRRSSSIRSRRTSSFD